MTRLADTQARFLDDIYGEGPLDAAREIYRRNMLANLLDALAATYPVVRRLVGGAFFGEAAARFARASPSRSGDLHRFGGGFAEFLADYPHAASLPYLPDVARLEWAVAGAFHAADPGHVDFARLAAAPEAERIHVRFRLQAGARLLSSAFPIAAIWEANQADRDGTPGRESGAEHVLVHREGFVVRVRAVGELDWRFLRAVAAGTSLEDLAEDPELAAALETLLVQWTGNHVIDDFALPPRS
jgi:hypothetical protein